MSLRKKKDGKDSDGEEEEIELGAVAKPEHTRAEVLAAELADVPTIPDSEISPAAYIFQQ